MDELIEAIRSTPIIDNHAHPLLKPDAQARYPLLAITTEAHGEAMKATPSSLSHIRAVRQLSEILGCPATWHDVVGAIDVEKSKPDDAWTKRCLEGIETILVDDGLDGQDEVFDYSWHDRLTRTRCKRIVRIEKVAEEIIDELRKQGVAAGEIFPQFMDDFVKTIEQSIADPEVVGFKSVICYRTGLDIPFSMDGVQEEMELEFCNYLKSLDNQGVKEFKRVDGLLLNPYLVHQTASYIQRAPSSHKKPFQFHTGLGDNDITLTTSSPSHMQEFIRAYPTVPIVLLHASYPWTKEAGYLASVYENVYADIGEVFPFLSAEGQENVVREILELCPTEKILWSTDGHWFPETYLLAVIQVREALEKVLCEYVARGELSASQAIKVVEDVLFTTSNDLYNLQLPLRRLSPSNSLGKTQSELRILTDYLRRYPSTKYLRLQYLDYTATPRLRIIPVKRAISLLQARKSLSTGITKAALGLLQTDIIIPGVTATGEYKLNAVFSSLRVGPAKNYASFQCEFLEADGSEAELCPRSVCRRVVEKAKAHNLEIQIGFEIEIVFMPRESTVDIQSATPSLTKGHSWSSARALDSEPSINLLDEIYEALEDTGIDLEQFHPESADGQFEFILPPLPPLEAIDTLLHAREIITTVAAAHGFRATLHPKPFPSQGGTASHVHLSLRSTKDTRSEVDTHVYEAFYAGILQHLRSITAFSYSKPASYDRMVDGCWAGGTWVAWGTQNRETALRKIEGSHWEFKILDGLANVYLAVGAIIAAGTHGVTQKSKLLLKDCAIDPANLSEKDRKGLGIALKLPKNLDEAMAALDGDQEMRDLLGNAMVDRYLRVKREEVKLLGGMNADERRLWLIERY